MKKSVLWIIGILFIFQSLSFGQDIDAGKDFDLVGDNAKIFFVSEIARAIQFLEIDDFSWATIKWKVSKEGCYIVKIKFKSPDGTEHFKVIGIRLDDDCIYYIQ